MQPRPWQPAEVMSVEEAEFVQRLKRKSRFFILMREIRQDVLSAKLEAELRAMYRGQGHGRQDVLGVSA